MISHTEQLEAKLVTAIMTAYGSHKGPVHLSIPLDIMRSAAPTSKPSYNLRTLLKTPNIFDTDAVRQLGRELLSSKNPVFILGSACNEAASTILQCAYSLNAKVITSCDGKGLISPYHPLYRGVIGFAGHQSAVDLLNDKEVDLIVAIGTTLGEWNSNGWDQDTIMNNRLIHIDSTESHLMNSPMARLHVRGRLLTIFEHLAAKLIENRGQFWRGTPSKNILPLPAPDSLIGSSSKDSLHFSMENPSALTDDSTPIKPQWLMGQLTTIFPANTKYVIDSGNSFAWAAHYLHPFDRRSSGRRLKRRSQIERRQTDIGLFQAAIEFSSMGWAIGSAIGASMAATDHHVVCMTGDGSWLMSGQEITTAVQEQLSTVFIILNDSALGMVKHGQRLAGAEPTGFQLPEVNFAQMANSVGAKGYLIKSPQELLKLNIQDILSSPGPTVIDIHIDAEQIPPMGLRMKVLQKQQEKNESIP